MLNNFPMFIAKTEILETTQLPKTGFILFEDFKIPWLSMTFTKIPWLSRFSMICKNSAHVSSIYLLTMPNTDEIIWFSLVYARSKGDRMFTTTWAEILAYLALNILIGSCDFPQLSMYWDSDEFIRVESFKKLFPKQYFLTLGTCYRRPKWSPAKFACL